MSRLTRCARLGWACPSGSSLTFSYLDILHMVHEQADPLGQAGVGVSQLEQPDHAHQGEGGVSPLPWHKLGAGREAGQQTTLL